MPPKKRSKNALNKSEFVRKLGDGLSAAEIVEKAKAAGVDLTPGHVYTIRAAAKRSQGIPARSSGRKPARPTGSGRSARGGSQEQQFITLVLELGLKRAEELLAKVRAGIRVLS